MNMKAIASNLHIFSILIKPCNKHLCPVNEDESMPIIIEIFHYSFHRALADKGHASKINE